MKVDNENFDKVLNKLAASVRSPRGRFSAENSWKLLQERMRKHRTRRRFLLRIASSAAVVLLCVASWAAYHAVTSAPEKPEATQTETRTARQPEPRVLAFEQQTLQEIADSLSGIFRTPIRVEGASLQQYRMTATFKNGESLTEILDLLKEAGNFDYKQTNDTITLTSKLN